MSVQEYTAQNESDFAELTKSYQEEKKRADELRDELRVALETISRGPAGLSS